jgi:hypothetical protein
VAGQKKAGEYSEEDTHRPAHHYREVVARRTFGRAARQSADTFPRERDAVKPVKVSQLDNIIVTLLPC